MGIKDGDSTQPDMPVFIGAVEQVESQRRMVYRASYARHLMLTFLPLRSALGQLVSAFGARIVLAKCLSLGERLMA